MGIKNKTEVRNRIYDTAILINPEHIKFGKGVVIGSFVMIHGGKKTVFGDYSCMHTYSSIVGGGECIIGKRVGVGYYTQIITATDHWKTGKRMTSTLPLNQRDVRMKKVVIEDDVYISNHCIIMPGVTIGKGAVIGAFSYVDKDVGPYVVMVPSQGYKFKKRKLKL